MQVSIIIRTYNEERYLDVLLRGIREQRVNGVPVETLVVDSGSTDRTLDIAREHRCRIENISKEDFTFGRSLNVGCRNARGDYFVFVSGHCYPVNESWLSELIAPLSRGAAEYTYGRQIGNGRSRFSEKQLFQKYFPQLCRIPQDGFFCNNANAALKRDTWERFPFNEDLPGLEDMELGKRITQSGGCLGYVSKAMVYHIHRETWKQVRNRYEREAIALQQIMPEIQVGFSDFVRFFISGVLYDAATSLREKNLHRTFGEIVLFRLFQYWGVYRGNHLHRQLSKKQKENYFFPR